MTSRHILRRRAPAFAELQKCIGCATLFWSQMEASRELPCSCTLLVWRGPQHVPDRAAVMAARRPAHGL